MTASDGPHPVSPGMPPVCGYEVRAEFDHLVIRDDFVADLAGNKTIASLSSSPS